MNSSTARRHFAEFVLAPEPRQHNFEIAAGEFAHGLAHLDHRPGNPLSKQDRQYSAEQEAAGREHQDQPLGLSHGRVRFLFKPSLLGNQAGLHCARALDDRRRRFVHFE